MVCRAIKRVVWAHGIKAETFTSASDFIAMLEAVPSLQLGCVVLDMHMPGRDGLEVQARLAALRPGVPVIFVTAAVAIGVKRRAIEAGAAAFFRKPFDVDTFVKTLRAVLKMERPDT
jgi:FixJ family two-component response regulator